MFIASQEHSDKILGCYQNCFIFVSFPWYLHLHDYLCRCCHCPAVLHGCKLPAQDVSKYLCALINSGSKLRDATLCPLCVFLIFNLKYDWLISGNKARYFNTVNNKVRLIHVCHICVLTTCFPEMCLNIILSSCRLSKRFPSKILLFLSLCYMSNHQKHNYLTAATILV